jgi:hypothetical protein
VKDVDDADHLISFNIAGHDPLEFVGQLPRATNANLGLVD